MGEDSITESHVPLMIDLINEINDLVLFVRIN